MSLVELDVKVETDAGQKVETRELPLLDLGKFLAGDRSDNRALADELRQAGEEVGFLAVVNHGIPQNLIDQAIEQNMRFCALPMERKLEIKINRDQRGYIPPKATLIRHSEFHDNTKFDLNETTVFATEHDSDDVNVVAGMQFYGKNQWPRDLPGFKDVVRSYMGAMESLGRKLLPLWALALDMPEDYFQPYFKNGYTYYRMAHYPPAATQDENEFALGAHADTGFMTLLPSADVEGLEIMDADGIWFRPAKIDGAIHVNIGQFLNRWTNERLRATPHRVAIPKADRYTVPVFVNPDLEPVVHCIPTCADKDNPPKYEPESYYDFFKWYMANSYPHYAEFHAA